MASKKELHKSIKQKTEKELEKPFGFCCQEKTQDFNTAYDQRRPPSSYSLTNVLLNGGGPNLKFRIQDIHTKSPKFGIKYSKSVTAHVGGCKWCRGPLSRYLENEISTAKKIFYKNRQKEYKKALKEVIFGKSKSLKRRKKKRREELTKSNIKK